MFELLTDITKSSEALVGLSAFLATFVASVMADEQSHRLKQGTFGALAGTAVGGLAAVIDKQPTLLLIGVFGSAAGAIVGWIVYLGLSALAGQRWRWARRLIEYHVTGLKGVRDQLHLDERNQILSALNIWSQNFRGMVLRETHVILASSSSKDYNAWVKIALRGWLTSLIDAFNLVLDALAEKPEYRSRVTLVVFGSRSGEAVGRHWISYAGHQQSHTKRAFGPQSIAYQVLDNQKESPYFTTIERGNKEGETRGSTESSYSSFFVFRLNDSVVLSMDWPGKHEVQDPYVNVAKALLQLDVAPAMGELLDKWSGEIASEVGLEPLAKATTEGQKRAAESTPAVTPDRVQSLPPRQP